jgi:undecaprenyl-diphosphatase
MAVGFLGTMFNQILKLMCRVPRPWVLDPEFTILEQAREAASGYSFPSGHSQSAVGTFGGIAYTTENKWVKGLCIAIAVLVPLSRMYVGVHTPWDVLVGSAMALALIIDLRKPVLARKDKNMKTLIAVMLAVSVGYLLYVELFPFPADFDAHNLESGTKNAYTMVGCLVGVAIVYIVDSRYVNFDTKAVWWAQILKGILGLGTVLAIKEGLRSPLELVLPVLSARAVRYFLIVVWAGIGWPSTFRFFAKLGDKK